MSPEPNKLKQHPLPYAIVPIWVREVIPAECLGLYLFTLLVCRHGDYPTTVQHLADVLHIDRLTIKAGLKTIGMPLESPESENVTLTIDNLPGLAEIGARMPESEALENQLKLTLGSKARPLETAILLVGEAGDKYVQPVDVHRYISTLQGRIKRRPKREVIPTAKPIPVTSYDPNNPIVVMSDDKALGDPPMRPADTLPANLTAIFVAEGKVEVALNVWLHEVQFNELVEKHTMDRVMYCAQSLTTWSVGLDKSKLGIPYWQSYRKQRDHGALLVKELLRMSQRAI